MYFDLTVYRISKYIISYFMTVFLGPKSNILMEYFIYFKVSIKSCVQYLKHQAKLWKKTALLHQRLYNNILLWKSRKWIGFIGNLTMVQTQQVAFLCQTLLCFFSFLILTEYGHGDQNSLHQYVTLGINSLYAVKGALFIIQTLQLVEEISSYELEACFLLSENRSISNVVLVSFFPHHLLGFLSCYSRSLFLYIFCSLLSLVTGSLQGMNKQRIMHKMYAKYNSKGEVILKLF